ncbi:MAG: SIS domain-containing protein [Patescibacteria group bacterium]
MMYDAIQNFPAQLGFTPEIENKGKLGAYERYVVLGMGGSNLAPGLLNAWKPALDIASHRDYGLPYISDGARATTLVIASSYSGNTEETIDGFEEAGRRGLARAAVSAGGRLRDLARDAGVPYVPLPNTGIQPRSALGLSIKALLRLMGEHQALDEIAALAAPLASRMVHLEQEGKDLAGRMHGYAPVVYASRQNATLAQNWKIKFNETAKIPAFWNAFPEVNHNEMTGFDAIASTRGLSGKLFFIFLYDASDHAKVQKRMRITEELYQGRGFATATAALLGAGFFEKAFSSVLTADWTAYYLSQAYGTEPELVPMVEEFKRRIASENDKRIT